MRSRCKFQVAFVFAVAVALMASGAFAQYQRIERPNVRFLRGVQIDGDAEMTTATIANSLTVTGVSTLGTVTLSTPTITSADINGGTIDGVTIGASAAPTVTNLGTVTTADINGGTIDGAIIGAAAARAGTFTTVTATTGVINTVLLPDADNGADIGSGTVEWKDLYIDGTANIDSLVADTADVNAGTVDAVVGGTTPAAGTFTTLTSTKAVQKELVLTATNYEITSPSLVINAADKGMIVLTSDESITGVTLAGGELNQKVEIRTGDGSNTIRFDDVTSLTAGGNITVTEGHNDVITFICVDATYGTIWTVHSLHDN